MKEDLETKTKKVKLDKKRAFVIGLITGLFTGAITDNYSTIPFGALYIGVGIYPFAYKAFYNQKYSTSFQESPYVGAGYIVGRLTTQLLRK